MTQQPFSRPGAIDLTALKRPATPPPAPGGDTSGAAGSAYSVRIDGETAFQSAIEASMTAPVVLVFYSPSRVAESTQMAQDVSAAADENEGRFLAALVDVDAVPSIAQAMQIQQVPLLMILLDGRPATQPIPGLVGLEELRTMFNQLSQQLTAQGITGRHQPQVGGAPATSEQGEEPVADPRYAAAEAALAADDIDSAVAEYQKLVTANPADGEAAAAHPDDVAAQTMVADLDLLGGHVEDAFGRLIELVRRTAGDERNAAREHLLGLFGAVGQDDPRVLSGRQKLASALY